MGPNPKFQPSEPSKHREPSKPSFSTCDPSQNQYNTNFCQDLLGSLHVRQTQQTLPKLILKRYQNIFFLNLKLEQYNLNFLLGLTGFTTSTVNPANQANPPQTSIIQIFCQALLGLLYVRRTQRTLPKLILKRYQNIFFLI